MCETGNTGCACVATSLACVLGSVWRLSSHCRTESSSTQRRQDEEILTCLLCPKVSHTNFDSWESNADWWSQFDIDCNMMATAWAGGWLAGRRCQTNLSLLFRDPNNNKSRCWTSLTPRPFLQEKLVQPVSMVHYNAIQSFFGFIPAGRPATSLEWLVSCCRHFHWRRLYRWFRTY